MSQQPFPLQPGRPEQPGQPYAGQQYPGQPAQYGTPPPPPAKKKRKWPWIVLAVIAFLVVVSVATGGGDKDEATAAGNTTAAATAKSDPKAAGLNTPVRDGKFEFVVTGVQTGLAEVGDNPYLAKKAQGQFVIVAMTVKNIGTKPQDFSPSSQKVKDAQGRSFESDSMAQIALGDSDVPVWDNINPGNTVQIKVVFDMPKDAAPATVELHDSMFSGGATVALK